MKDPASDGPSDATRGPTNGAKNDPAKHPARARTLVAGSLYEPGEGFVEGWLAHDGETILERGEGTPPERPAMTGLVLLPAPVDAHTHVGDYVARGRVLAGLTLAQVVAPPDGVKHQVLRDTPDAQLAAGMRAAIEELSLAGTRTFLDFRERGERGIRQLRAAAEGLGMRPLAMGRCEGAWSKEEALRVLDAGDGYGYSGLADASGETPADAPEQAAALARVLGKRFALHVSEDKREDVARALDLKPDFLVHAVHATEDDLAHVAAERVPIVLCPRSNARFGPLPDVPTMMREEIPLAVGSDNAMLHPLGVLLDVRLLHKRFPEIEAARFLDAAVLGGQLLAGGEALPLRKGARVDVIGLAPRGNYPWDAVFGATEPTVTWRSWTKG